ncbi:acyltransferase [Butyrivibrio proteoclasticus]|uniref:acyltransferase n=1 Tax=Butyrivibrio proteoclasticus TaxID=43305 RepID=UPI001FA800C2|nr:acyltransferase [Butyrivibrio proteoclasticus]
MERNDMYRSFYSEEELKNIGFKQYGKNVLISRLASFYDASQISIGNNVRIDDFCLLSGRIQIGNYIHIAAYSSLFSGSKDIIIDDFVNISSRCTIYSKSDDYSGQSLTGPMVDASLTNQDERTVHIQRHAIIGSGSTVLPGVTIEEGVAVGSMSLVKNTLTAWGIYAGIPCKYIKERTKKLLDLEKEQTSISISNKTY